MKFSTRYFLLFKKEINLVKNCAFKLWMKIRARNCEWSALGRLTLVIIITRKWMYAICLRILGALCALIFLRALGVFICLCASHALIFSRALLAFLFYVLCVLSLFCVPSFLRAYILFMYLVITQINEHLSTFIKYFHFYKTRVLFCMIFPFFETKNFNYF